MRTTWAWTALPDDEGPDEAHRAAVRRTLPDHDTGRPAGSPTDHSGGRRAAAPERTTDHV